MNNKEHREAIKKTVLIGAIPSGIIFFTTIFASRSSLFFHHVVYLIADS
jgi:hypothetical protein